MSKNKQTDLFYAQCNARLQQGAREYGDKSFYNTSASLTNDINEELLDIANWSAIFATTCEDVEALAFLQYQIQWAAAMSQKLAAMADKGTFETRCFRDGISSSGMVELARCFLKESL